MSDVPDTLWQLVDTQIERLTLRSEGPPSRAWPVPTAGRAGDDRRLESPPCRRGCATLARNGQFLRAGRRGLTAPRGTLRVHPWCLVGGGSKAACRLAIVWLHRHIGERLERLR
jgi:hypothetical protein